MRLLAFLLFVSLTGTAFAQEKKVDKKTEKKAEKKKAPAKKTEKKEKTQAQQPKQEWSRFSSNAQKDEKARAEKAAKK